VLAAHCAVIRIDAFREPDILPRSGELVCVNPAFGSLKCVVAFKSKNPAAAGFFLSFRFCVFVLFA
jgi:hypothetical protein